jgi:putative tryptophan/tyrosine transport system substrate-binding protein
MRKIALIAGALFLLAGCGSAATNAPAGKSTEAKKVKIGITQIVEHPSLDANRKGFIAALKDAGYEEGKNLELDVQIAQGDMSNNSTIAQKFVSDKDDLILAIATPSAQAAVKAAEGSNIPVVFSAISDPIGAKLITDLKKPGGNVTGAADTDPDGYKSSVKAIKDFFPNAKKVGVIYNSGEQNSVQNLKSAEAHMKELGLEPVEATVTKSSEVQQAAESLIGRADVIAYYKDNTVASALESVIKVANDHKIPFFAGDIDSVKRGSLAAYGFEEYDLGYKAGKMAVDILKGKKPGDIPVVFPEGVKLYINEKAVKAVGLTISDDIKKNAVIVGK